MLNLPSAIRVANASAVQQTLAQALRQQPADQPVTLDAVSLQHFDSSALAVLLALLRQARADGVQLEVSHMQPHLCELVSLYGVQELLTPAAEAAP